MCNKIYLYTFEIVLGLCMALFFGVLPVFSADVLDVDSGIFGDATSSNPIGQEWTPIAGYNLSKIGIKVDEVSTSSPTNLIWYVCEGVPEVESFTTTYNCTGAGNQAMYYGSCTDCFSDTSDTGSNELHEFEFDQPMLLDIGMPYYVSFFETTNNASFRIHIVDDGLATDFNSLTPYVNDAMYHRIYYDNSVSTTTYGFQQLTWHFPQDGYLLNNSEWNDWGVIYNISQELLEDWLILNVHSTQNYGVDVFTDWEEVTNTTGEVYWTMDRSMPFPDGDVISQAVLYAVSSSTDCQNFYDQDCIWNEVAYTPFITWTSSSTGGTIFDYGTTGFWPSTSSEATLLGNVLNLFKNIFPLNIIYQVHNVLTQLHEEQIDLATGEYDDTEFDYTLNTLLHDNYQLTGTASNTKILVSSYIYDNFPVYYTTIYPSIQWIIRLAGMFIIFMMIYKSVGGVKVNSRVDPLGDTTEHIKIPDRTGKPPF